MASFVDNERQDARGVEMLQCCHRRNRAAFVVALILTERYARFDLGMVTVER